MKKRKNTHKIDCVSPQNPVAKFARQFNRAHIFADKNQYRRNAKHRKQEASSITLAIRVIEEAFCFIDQLVGEIAFFSNKKLTIFI